MNSQNNTRHCPHCGTEHTPLPNAWQEITGETDCLCPNCKKEPERAAPPSHDHKEAGQEDAGKSSQGIFWLFFALLGALLFFLNRSFDVLSFKENPLQIIYILLFLFLAASFLASGRLREKMRHLAIWAVIFLLFLTGYAYRHELAAVKGKVVAELIPSKGYQETTNAISYPASSDGHFYIHAMVNGTPVVFLADTGASSIVLSPNDAERVGFDTRTLRYDRVYETANGRGRGSSIRIDDFRVGGIRLENIGASVNQAEMRESLLGMTFFRRLKRYEVKNDVLTLHW